MTKYLSRNPQSPIPHTLVADGALLVVTAIWGSTFVMVKDAVAAYPVFSFMALRFTFAALALLPLLFVRRQLSASRAPAALEDEEITQRRKDAKTYRSLGVVASLRETGVGIFRAVTAVLAATRASGLIGLALFAGYALQTAGLRLTTPAKAGFITGLSVVIVPVAAAWLLRQSPGRAARAGVGLATVGLALLSLRGDLTLAPGDLPVLGCAFAFAGHILLTSFFAARRDPVMLTLGQVLVVAVLSSAVAFIAESPPALTSRVLFAAAFTGLLATSLAFGIQTAAQRFTSATHTALIFAAEPVFAALFSYLMIGEVLGPRQLAGCGLILAGMVAGEVRRRE